MDTQAEIRISRARVALVMTAPFFATIALGLPMVEASDRPEIQTWATDGAAIYWNREFTDKMADPEILGVLAHEVLHVTNMHMTRRGNRDPRLWNVACDYAINPIVIDCGFKLPSGALLRDDFRDMSAEAIYDRLVQSPDEQPKRGGSGDSDPGGCGGVMDAAESFDTAKIKEIEAAVQTATVQAINAARAAGKLPGFAKDYIAKLRAPKVSWRETLRRFVDQAGSRELSWSRPNRRFIGSGLYLPGTTPEGISSLGILIDVSGSIQKDAFNAFMGEINEAVGVSLPDEVRVVQCSAKIVAEDRFGPGEEIEISLKAGGGTNMSEGLLALSDCAAVICFTDLQFGREPAQPDAPVLWAHYGKGGMKPSFGEIINID